MPAYNTDINFAPRQSSTSKALDGAISAGNKLFISVTTIILIVAGVVFYLNYTKRQEIKAVQANITQAQNDIDKLKDLGKEGYKLGFRLKNSETVINKRVYLSRVLQELKNRIPVGIALKELRLDDSGVINFVGYAEPNYTPITNYRASLLDKTKEKYFSDVKVVSSNFDKSTSKIEFTLSITLDPTNANGPAK